MLWVEQPIGTGFSIGTPSATSEEEIAQNFVDFFKNFEQLFGITNFKIYITGESYAGRYVPYISAAFLNQKDKKYFDLSGALMFDPCIGDFDYVQEEAVVVPYVQQNANLFNFNESFMADLESLHKSCGYEAYVDKYLQFPPKSAQPSEFFNYSAIPENYGCDVFDLINEAAFDPNPCFNIYEITNMCPIPWDVLGFPTELVVTPAGADIYFNRSDVKAALHAPQNINCKYYSQDLFLLGPCSTIRKPLLSPYAEERF